VGQTGALPGWPFPFSQKGEPVVNSQPRKLLRKASGKLARATHRLLAFGNDKLGDAIVSFGIPAVRTCPGMSTICRRLCYARGGRFRYPAVKKAYRRNVEAAQRPDFAARLIEEIARSGATVVRIHVSGDFFSADYVRAWTQVATAHPQVTFFAYTRSWRAGSIRQALDTFATLSNVRLWFSADRETGLPSDLPEGVRIAWLETKEEEDVPEGVDLVFRPRQLRKRPNARVPLSLVCPADVNQPDKKVTCGSCGSCWQ
jgi:hypothetical protein